MRLRYCEKFTPCGLRVNPNCMLLYKTSRKERWNKLIADWAQKIQYHKICVQSEARTQMDSWTSPLKYPPRGCSRSSCKLSLASGFSSHLFRPFYLPLAPTICPLDSEDDSAFKWGLGSLPKTINRKIRFWKKVQLEGGEETKSNPRLERKEMGEVCKIPCKARLHHLIQVIHLSI